MNATKQKRRPPEHPCTYYGDRIKPDGLSEPYASAPKLLEALKSTRLWVILATARNPEDMHPQAIQNAKDDLKALDAVLAEVEKEPT